MRIGMPRHREEALLCCEMEQRKEELTRLTVVLLDSKDARCRRKKEPLLRPLTVGRPPSGARATGKGDRGLAARVYCLCSLADTLGSGGGGNREGDREAPPAVHLLHRVPPDFEGGRGREEKRERGGARAGHLLRAVHKACDPVRDDKDDDDAWAKKKRDHAPVEMSYTLENIKWETANKRCMAFTKNTIENAIVGSIAECASVGEYLEKIKSQFTGSSKTYATQLLKQLVTEKYSGGAHGIREHILRMSNLAAKLKPMDDDLELKPARLVHLVMASLPRQFDNFVVNYNMNPEKWDIEKTIAMCVQEEDRLKAHNGGSINYVKDDKKRPFTQSNNGSPSKPYAKAPMQFHQKFQQRPMPVNKDQCLHWIPFDADYEKKRRMR
ncbi:hypothetical protein QYE76_001089 [Lolium multiflorum]|uniref:Uncharacterized protein n=1 Tax=Lolium multiflorum TaxID=4521 RepID=A0AAD8RKI1_LOLMU|nr:hypothetical protein QYE76_001089 [Lolium multiflorum]